MKRKIKLFSLQSGDKFIFSNTEFTVKYYKNNHLPIGNRYSIVCFDNSGELQEFIYNWEVKTEDS